MAGASCAPCRRRASGPSVAASAASSARPASALLSAVWGVLRVPVAPRSTPQQPARALARGRLRPLSASSLSREESESHSEE